MAELKIDRESLKRMADVIKTSRENNRAPVFKTKKEEEECKDLAYGVFVGYCEQVLKLMEDFDTGQHGGKTGDDRSETVGITVHTKFDVPLGENSLLRCPCCFNPNQPEFWSCC